MRAALRAAKTTPEESENEEDPDRKFKHEHSDSGDEKDKGQKRARGRGKGRGRGRGRGPKAKDGGGDAGVVQGDAMRSLVEKRQKIEKTEQPKAPAEKPPEPADPKAASLVAEPPKTPQRRGRVRKAKTPPISKSTKKRKMLQDIVLIKFSSFASYRQFLIVTFSSELLAGQLDRAATTQA